MHLISVVPTCRTQCWDASKTARVRQKPSNRPLHLISSLLFRSQVRLRNHRDRLWLQILLRNHLNVLHFQVLLRNHRHLHL